MNDVLTGEKIRILREARGWSQKELGEKLGLKQSNIGNIETGKNKLNKLDVVFKLLEIFDISFDFLFEDTLTAIETENNSNFLRSARLELVQMDVSKLYLAHDITYYYTKVKGKK